MTDHSQITAPTRTDTGITIVDPVPTAPTVPVPAISGPTSYGTVRVPRSKPLPNGGFRAWMVVFGSFLIHCFAFAPTEYVFGIFEHHYQDTFPDATASSIAFVGTTGSAVTYLAGFLAGFMADRAGFRLTALCGTVLMSVALVLASFCTQLWQLYCTQGVMFGIGASLAYYPAIAAPSHWFRHTLTTRSKVGLATGIAVSGVGAGGFVLAPLTNALIAAVDVYWTLRILALMSLVVCGVASFLIAENKEHVEQKQEEAERNVDHEQTVVPEGVKPEDGPKGDSWDQKPTFLASLKIFKNPQFLSLSLAELAASVGYLIPLYYMQTYAVFIGLSPQKGALILGLSNGASFAGRILLGLLSDYISNAKVLLVCSWMTAFSVLVLWTISKSFGTLLLMGLTFGFFAGGYVSLVPVAVAESFGTQELASTIGLMYAAGGLGVLGGSPLAGFLLDSTRPDISYIPVTMTAGGTLTLGALCVSTWAYFNWRSKRSPRPNAGATSA